MEYDQVEEEQEDQRPLVMGKFFLVFMKKEFPVFKDAPLIMNFQLVISCLE